MHNNTATAAKRMYSVIGQNRILLCIPINDLTTSFLSFSFPFTHSASPRKLANADGDDVTQLMLLLQ